MAQLLENNFPYVKDNKGLTTDYPVTINANLTVNGTITSSGTGMEGAQVITATSANALAVGQAGTTNPAFNINTNTASSATGIQITSNAAGSGVAAAVISSGTNENFTIDAKGSGTVTINGTATGIVKLPASTITSSSANALTVGPNGTTNYIFNIDTSATSAAAGIDIVGAAAGGGGPAINVVSSATNENFNISAKGSGAMYLNVAGTGNVITQTTTIVANNVSTTAGGVAMIGMGKNTSTPFYGAGIYFGSGVPTITAPQGSIYLRSDGSSTSTRFYINTTGSTTWTNVTTAA